jgi:hypothetical protein
MRFLGHKNIKNTLRYIHLISFDKNEWICKATRTTEEAQKLVEADFQYVVTTPEGLMLFRKPK